MANLKKAKAYAFATIAAAQTILEKYPNLSTTDSFISINASTNPFDFLTVSYTHLRAHET